jgi:transcriptional regulator with XRE-family HTH domain
MDANGFGEMVRKRRKAEGMNQSKLASETGISRNYLSEIERGEATHLSWEIRKRLCMVLGIPLDELALEISQTFSESLIEFAERANLPTEDINMLARLNYRGKQPDTPEKWKILYGVIKMTMESAEG